MGKKVLGGWLPVAAWMAVIFYLSSQPKPPMSWLVDRVDWGDKLAHVLAYTILGLLVRRAIAGLGLRWNRSWVVVIIGAAYGLTDEAHQVFVPGRSFDLSDLAADALGAALGTVSLDLYLGGGGRDGRAGRREDL